MAERCLIRPTSLADLPALVSLELAAFSDPWTADQLLATLRARGGYGDVAVAADGAVVGHLIGRLVVDHGEILSLATDPGARRQGVATALLDATMVRMATAEATALWLEVRESNAAARALYGARGFLEQGRRKGYYSAPIEDALILSLQLAPSASEGSSLR